MTQFQKYLDNISEVDIVLKWIKREKSIDNPHISDVIARRLAEVDQQTIILSPH